MSQAPGDQQRPESRIGATLAGRYRLTRVLGTGGMGAVYEANHTTTGKKVAVKLLAPQLSRDLKLVARFRREALAASRLDHENCVHVDDFGEDVDGTFYIAMELVAGCGLGDELRAHGPMAPGRVARIGVQLFKALDAAHVGGVLHRDLKPQNVMIASRPGRVDVVKVVDFGIAKLTSNEPGEVALTVPGTIFGTPEYMSPEQARGETLDARSDIYSACVVLWHMLLGRSPFRGPSVRDTLIKVFAEEAPSPLAERPGLLLPAGFEEVLRRGLAKNRDQRWPDAASAAAALMPFTEGALIDLPQRAQAGLTRDGSPQASTLEKMPAIALRDTVPGADVPLAVSPTELTRPATMRPAPPEPVAAGWQPPTAVLAPPPTALPWVPPAPPSALPPTMPSTAVAAEPFAFTAPAAASGVVVVRPAAPPVPPGPPSPARVITIDAVKQQTTAVPLVSIAPPPPRRRGPTRISAPALIVIIGGTLLLTGFVVVVWLVLTGRVDTDPSSPTPPSAAVPSTAATPTTPTTNDSPAFRALSVDGDRPVDTLARDAALGRAARAVAAGKSIEARAAYEDAVVADPTSPTALIGLGSVAMQLHDWTLARDCFGKVVAIDSTYRRQFNSVYARARDKAEKEALQEAAP